MKASLVVIVVLVIAILGFLLIYSQKHEVTTQAQQAPAAAGYGSAPAAGGYGGQHAAPASGYGK